MTGILILLLIFAGIPLLGVILILVLWEMYL